MQRSVDRCRYTVLAKRRQGIVADHLVFVLLAAVESLQLLQTIEIKQRESRFRDRADITAAAFYGKHMHRLTSEWIRQLNFRTRVPTAEVGDSEVGPQQVRSIPKKS